MSINERRGIFLGQEVVIAVGDRLQLAKVIDIPENSTGFLVEYVSQKLVQRHELEVYFSPQE